MLTHFFHAQFVDKTAKTVHTRFIKRPTTQSLSEISLFASVTNSNGQTNETYNKATASFFFTHLNTSTDGPDGKSIQLI